MKEILPSTLPPFPPSLILFNTFFHISTGSMSIFYLYKVGIVNLVISYSFGRSPLLTKCPLRFLCIYLVVLTTLFMRIIQFFYSFDQL